MHLGLITDIHFLLFVLILCRYEQDPYAMIINKNKIAKRSYTQEILPIRFAQSLKGSKVDPPKGVNQASEKHILA